MTIRVKDRVAHMPFKFTYWWNQRKIPLQIPEVKFKTLPIAEHQVEIAWCEDELQEVVSEHNYGKTQNDIFCKKHQDNGICKWYSVTARQRVGAHTLQKK
jgi:hypothetical protein